MLPFTSHVLSAVVDKRRPVATPIRNAHFGGPGQNYGTPHIQLDILTSPEGLATAISHGVKSKRAPKDGWETKTITIPRFSEHDIVKASDLIGLRAPGQQTASEALQRRVLQKTDTIRARFDRTLEYMCIKAMQGQVVDGGGNVIATYAVPASSEVDFQADGSADSPIDVFDDAAVTISRALGQEAGNLIAYCGTDAYKKLRNEATVQALLTGPQGPQLLENGEVRRVGGVTTRRLAAVYADDDGNDQPFLAANEILIASDQMGGEIVYGPCEAPGGLRIQSWFVDTWEDRDPPADYVRVETNPLPVVKRPDSIVRHTVA